MIKIILFSKSDDNIKKISGLLEGREDFKLTASIYGTEQSDLIDSDNANLVLFDLTGFTAGGRSFKKDLDNINSLISNPSVGKILILEPDQLDYLFKEFPFTHDFLFADSIGRELLPRIDFLLYKMKLIIPSDRLVIGDMMLNMDKYELMVGSKVVVLTFKEFEMLKLLMQNKNKVFTRSNLLSTVWDYDYYGGSRTVDVHMRRLRAKIPPPYNDMLKTIRNVGYMFSPEE